MFEKLELLVLKLKYKYYRHMSNKYYERINIGYVSEDNAEMWEEWLGYNNLANLAQDEIYQIEGIY